jgi:hypothetical protein
VLARVGGNETISGTWTFSNPITVGTTVLAKGVGMEVFNLGGDWREFISTGGSYPTGATFDKLAPGTGVFYLNPTLLLPGTYAVEGVCRTITGSPGGGIGLFDLDGGAPNTAIATAGGTLNTTGVFVRSTAITFPDAVRTFGVKLNVDAGSSISCHNIRIVRLT